MNNYAGRSMTKTFVASRMVGKQVGTSYTSKHKELTPNQKLRQLRRSIRDNEKYIYKKVTDVATLTGYTVEELEGVGINDRFMEISSMNLDLPDSVLKTIWGVSSSVIENLRTRRVKNAHWNAVTDKKSVGFQSAVEHELSVQRKLRN